MTVVTRWDPFREFSTLQDRMNRLFRDSYGDGREEALTTSTFAPPVDVYEDEHNVVLKIEVPGIRVVAHQVKGVSLDPLDLAPVQICILLGSLKR